MRKEELITENTCFKLPRLSALPRRIMHLLDNQLSKTVPKLLERCESGVPWKSRGIHFGEVRKCSLFEDLHRPRYVILRNTRWNSVDRNEIACGLLVGSIPGWNEIALFS